MANKDNIDASRYLADIIATYRLRHYELLSRDVELSVLGWPQETSKKVLENLIQDIDDDKRKVVCLRFGLNRKSKNYFYEVGLEIGLKQERTRQILSLAMREMVDNEDNQRYLRTLVEDIRKNLNKK